MAVANPAQEVGGWGGVAVPLAKSLDLLLMTHQARVILYLPCRICQLSGLSRGGEGEGGDNLPRQSPDFSS